MYFSILAIKNHHGRAAQYTALTFFAEADSVNQTDTTSMRQDSKLHCTVALSRELGVLTVPKARTSAAYRMA